MQTILVTGSTSDFGSAFVERYRSRGERVIGVSRHPPSEEGYVTADLLDQQACAEAAFGMDLEGIERLVFIHGVGSISFEEDTSHLDPDSFASNYSSFANMAHPLLIRAEEEGRPFDIVSFGSLSDSYEVPWWKTYTRCNNRRRKEIEAMVRDHPGLVRGVFISLPSVDTPSHRKLRPNANFSYWMKPEEVAERCIPYITNPHAPWIEVAISNVPPGVDLDAYFHNHQAIYERWMKEMGREQKRHVA